MERPPPLNELGEGLLRVSPWDRFVTLAVPLVATGWYVFFAWLGGAWWLPAVLAVMLLSFVTYGSTSHDLVHRNLGLPRGANDALLRLIEGLSLRSGTAYRRTHLHHHRRFPRDDDIEGSSAGSLWRTLAQGPVLQFRLWWWTWREFPNDRRKLVVEAGWVVLFVAASIALLPWTAIPAVYAALVIAGSWAFPLVTVYIPHDPAGRDALRQTRLFRGRVLSLIALDHLYHLEHHLYPMVPHTRRKELARRLDPYLEAAGVKQTRLWV